MVLATLLPVRCPVCDATGAAPCVPCVARMRPAVRGPVPPGLDLCGSLLAYEGGARTLVARLKYRNDRAALAWLADGMAALVEPPPGLVVTWAPTSTRRRRQRGFDQAELLAAAVARRWAVPCRRLLERDHGPPQTGLSLLERRRGPSFRPTVALAPALAPIPAASPGSTAAPTPRPARAPGCHVIVIDDVTTTGSTLTAASWALRSAGASWVGALTAARTPRLAAILPAVPPSVPPSVSRSVPLAPPVVESPLKFGGRSADVSR